MFEQSRETEILKSIIDDTEYNKTPQSRNEEILVSILNDTEYTKTPQSREEELLLQLKDVIEDGKVIKHVSGNPIEFTDGADAPLVKCVTAITGSQDLHGQTHPWVGGSGKNKAKPAYNGNTIGMTVTEVKDNGNNILAYEFTGTATGTSGTILFEFPISNQEKEYKIVRSDVPATANTFVWNNTTSSSVPFPNNLVTIPANNVVVLAVVLAVGTTLTNATIKFMILDSTEADSTFTPYSNICPITAYTEGEIEVGGKNKLPMIVSDIKSVNTDGTWTDNQYQLNGVTFDLQTNANGDITGIKVNGTSSTLTRLWIMTNENMADYSSCILSMKNATANCSFIILQRVSPWAVYAMANSDSDVVIQNASDNAMFYIEILANKTVNTTLYPMIRYVGSSPDFVPYTAPTTHTTTYPSAIYRGSEDCVNGSVETVKIKLSKKWSEGTSTTVIGDFTRKAFALSSDAVRNDENAICNVAPRILNYTSDELHFYVATSTALVFLPNDTDENTDIEIVYELATPTTSSVTPTNLPIKSIAGYNHISSTTGDMEIEYIKKDYQKFVDTVEEALPNTRKGGIKAIDIFKSLVIDDEKEFVK